MHQEFCRPGGNSFPQNNTELGESSAWAGGEAKDSGQGCRRASLNPRTLFLCHANTCSYYILSVDLILQTTTLPADLTHLLPSPLALTISPLYYYYHVVSLIASLTRFFPHFFFPIQPSMPQPASSTTSPLLLTSHFSLSLGFPITIGATGWIPGWLFFCLHFLISGF
jgi:hypothetical protein